jgi:hypothetical protein
MYVQNYNYVMTYYICMISQDTGEYVMCPKLQVMP